MPSKDVELIIRAKNEATKAIDQVNEALKSLTKTQQDTSDSAKKTDGILGQLGDELTKLQARAQGLKAFGTIVQQFELAGAAVKRLGADLKTTVSDLAKLKSETAAAAASTAQLATEAKAASQAYATQKQVVAGAKAALTAINAEVRKAEASYASLGRQVAQLKSPNAQLSAALAAQKAVLDQLKAKQDQLRASYDQEKAALKSATQAHKELSSAVKVSAANESKLQASVAKTAAAAERETVALTAANVTLAEIGAVANQASTALGGVAVSEQAVGTAAQKAAQELAAIAAALDRQRALRTPGAIDQGPAAAATAAYKAQTAAVAAAWTEMRKAADVARELGAALQATVAPSEELRRSELLARAASDQAVASYNEQVAALAKLRAATAGGGGVRAFLAEEQRLAAATKAAAGETRTLGQALRALASNFGLVSSAAGTAGGRVSIFKTALAAATGETRTALGVFQRVRGQLLALASGYVGVVGAIQGLRSVIGVIQQVEGAQSRLGAVFGQSGAAVQQEMRFIQQNAERLGISFGVLSDEYSKFAVAAKAANFESENTRKIFIAVAEAGRVNQLSQEQLQRTFMALQQMISKGTVSSEELRQQLGEALPGAFTIFADALGVTTEKLQKMLKAGQVVADQKTLGKFADELNKKFGPQLSKSLNSVTTSLGRFSNELFKIGQLVATGGFATGLKTFLDQLTAFLNTKGGQQFFMSIGAGIKSLLGLFPLLIENLDLVVIAFKLFLGYKIGLFISSITVEALRLVPALARVGIALDTVNLNAAFFRNAFVTATGAAKSFAAFVVKMPAMLAQLNFSMISAARGMGILRGAMTVVGGAINVLGKVLRGFAPLLLALVVTEVISFFLDMATEVDDATETITEHERIVGEVAKAYNNATNKAGEWQKGIENVTFAQAQQNLDKVRKEVTATADALVAGLKRIPKGIPLTEADVEIQKLARLRDQFFSNEITAKELGVAIDDLNKNFETPAAKAFAADLSLLAEASAKARDRNGEAATVMRQMGDNSKLTTRDVELYGGTLEKLAGQSEKVGVQIIRSGGGVRVIQTAFTNAKPALDGYAKSVTAVGEAHDKAGVKIIETKDGIQIIDTAAVEAAASTDAYAKAIDSVGESAQQTKDVSEGIEASTEAMSEGSTEAQASAKRLDGVLSDILTTTVPSLQTEGKETFEGMKESSENAKTEIDANLKALETQGTTMWAAIATAAEAMFSRINTGVDGTIRKMNELFAAAQRAVLESEKAGGGSGGGGGGGHAAGGAIRGPGTGTSDSIPAWLSTGEWVIKAKAVKKYGAEIFDALNSMRVPPAALRNMLKGYAMGGPVKLDFSGAFAGAAARMNEGGPVQRVQVDLSMGGQTFAGLMAPRDVADKLVKFALNENVRSGGRKPSWYT